MLKFVAIRGIDAAPSQIKFPNPCRHYISKSRRLAIRFSISNMFAAKFLDILQNCDL